MRRARTLPGLLGVQYVFSCSNAEHTRGAASWFQSCIHLTAPRSLHSTGRQLAQAAVLKIGCWGRMQHHTTRYSTQPLIVLAMRYTAAASSLAASAAAAVCCRCAHASLDMTCACLSLISWLLLPLEQRCSERAALFEGAQPRLAAGGLREIEELSTGWATRCQKPRCRKTPAISRTVKSAGR